MPQHRLDEARVRAVVEHVGRHRVPEQVGTTSLLDAGMAQQCLDPVGEEPVRQGLAVGGDEERVVIGDQQLWARFDQVFLHPGAGAFANRDQAILVALAGGDAQ